MHGGDGVLPDVRITPRREEKLSMRKRISNFMKCTCHPSQGYHQYECEVSRRMRAEIREASKIPEPPDPTKRAKA